MSLPVVTTSHPSQFVVPGYKQVSKGVVFSSGLQLAAGTLVSKLTSGANSGQWVAYDHSGTHGEAIPCGVLAQNLDTTTAGNGANVQSYAVHLGGGFAPGSLTGTDAYYVAAAVAAGYPWFIDPVGTLVLPS